MKANEENESDLKLICLLLIYLAIMGTPLAAWWIFRQLAKLTERSVAALMAAVILAALASIATTPANAQTVTWTDGAQDGDWSNPANWTPHALPGSTTNVEIAVIPPSGAIVIRGRATIASLVVDAAAAESAYAGPFGIGATSGGELDPLQTLQINGDIRNLAVPMAQGQPSGAFDTLSFYQVVIAGADATWQGSLDFRSNLEIGAHKITVLDAPTFTPSGIPQTLTLAINDSTHYGQFLGPAVIDFTGLHVTIAGAYVGHQGDVFALSEHGFFGATFDAMPTLSEGYSWDTSQLETLGVLSIQGIPEPSTYASLLFALGVFVVAKNPRFRLRRQLRKRSVLSK